MDHVMGTPCIPGSCKPGGRGGRAGDGRAKAMTGLPETGNCRALAVAGRRRWPRCQGTDVRRWQGCQGAGDGGQCDCRTGVSFDPARGSDHTACCSQPPAAIGSGGGRIHHARKRTDIISPPHSAIFMPQRTRNSDLIKSRAGGSRGPAHGRRLRWQWAIVSGEPVTECRCRWLGHR